MFASVGGLALLAGSTASGQSPSLPRAIQLGEPLSTLRPLLAEDCDQREELHYIGEMAAPFDEQVQVNCSGMEAYGAERNVELLFNDGPLGHVWILVETEELGELRGTLEESFGPVVFETELDLVFASGTVALRLDPPEILVASPEVLAALTGYRREVAACRARLKDMRRALEATHEGQRNVGLSAAVMLEGELVASETLGLADLEHQVPVTAKTRFGVASITKSFTGAALLKLWEEGKIDLDAPIQRYVPAFPEKPGGTVTPRLLAAHLAGIRHWKDERTPELYARHIEDVADILPLFADDPLLTPPGTEYSYSSHGYNLLAVAIQAAAGQSFQEYVRRTILSPLGLESTDFDNVKRVVPHRARRYSYYEPVTYEEDTEAVYRVPEWDYSHNMGGGNMVATAEDLVRFGHALTAPGLLSEKALDLLYTPARTQEVESPWSFGWFVTGPEEERRRLHITGANAGVQAALYVYPDDDLVVSVLSNTWGIGSRSGEMVVELPRRLAALCGGWAEVEASAP